MCITFTPFSVYDLCLCNQRREEVKSYFNLSGSICSKTAELTISAEESRISQKQSINIYQFLCLFICTLELGPAPPIQATCSISVYLVAAPVTRPWAMRKTMWLFFFLAPTFIMKLQEYFQCLDFGAPPHLINHSSTIPELVFYWY